MRCTSISKGYLFFRMMIFIIVPVKFCQSFFQFYANEIYFGAVYFFTRSYSCITWIFLQNHSLVSFHLQIWQQFFTQQTSPSSLKRNTVNRFWLFFERSFLRIKTFNRLIPKLAGKPDYYTFITHSHSNKSIISAILFFTCHVDRAFSVNNTSNICQVNLRNRMNWIWFLSHHSFCFFSKITNTIVFFFCHEFLRKMSMLRYTANQNTICQGDF